jgi:hypothetical protein
MSWCILTTVIGFGMLVSPELAAARVPGTRTTA